jgi:hypothetical protein
MGRDELHDQRDGRSSSAAKKAEACLSDFRALIATGFVHEIVRDDDGNVTALVVDLRDVPNAVRGQGGANCANA